MSELTTFRVVGPNGPAALSQFGEFYAGALWDVHKPD
jgi:hypothetical protein